MLTRPNKVVMASFEQTLLHGVGTGS